MEDSLGKTLQSYPRPYLTDSELSVLLEGTPDSRYGKIKRLLAQDKLLRVRRGLYCLTEQIGYFTKPHPYELAQVIYGPSYISLESALSYHQLIPEAVYTTTSVTSRRAKTFQTPLGEFSYQCLPAESLYTEVELIEENGYRFFMATPWKAICDYVFCYKKDWTNLEPLVKSLRINLEDLPILHDKKIQLLDEYYKRKRVSRFLMGVHKNLSSGYEY